MGGGYPSGHSFNFWGSNASLAAHVVNTWKGRVVYIGDDIGEQVRSGGPLMAEGPMDDPVRAAYAYYTYGSPRFSWDPLTVLYAIYGLEDWFKSGNDFGYNKVEPNGSNHWVWDEAVRNQFFLRLNADNNTLGRHLDSLLLRGARRGGRESRYFF